MQQVAPHYVPDFKNDDIEAAVSDGHVKSPKLVWNQAAGAPLGHKF